VLLGKLDIHMKIKRLDPSLSPCTKINSACIPNILMQDTETLKLLEENLGQTLQYVDIGNNFLNRTQIAQEIKAKIDQWDCIRLKALHIKGNN
jgi:hypothetical protein